MISVVLFTLFAPPAIAHIASTFGAPAVFALMMLTFATFIGLGGDDIANTIFFICIGLVLAAVELDIVSGQPPDDFRPHSWLFAALRFFKWVA